MNAARPAPEGPAGPRRRWTLAAMLFAVAMTFIDQTIVAIASPTVQSQLALSRSATLWVVNAYLLALAAAFAFGGRLADVLGARRMAVAGIIGFAGASALCGATPKGAYAAAWIIGFRILQGISGALMIPAALAVVVAAFPVRERGRALALFFAVSGGMTAIGPIAGGYLSRWTWRSIFWINIPIAVVALVLTAVARIPDVRRPDRIDVGGAVLTVLGMGLSVLGFEQAQTWGWHSAATWGCIVGGLVLLAVFAVYETKVASPLIRIRIFRDRGFVVDNAVLFLSQTAFVPVFFFASVYAQVSLGFDATESGLYLLMIFAGFAPAAQVGGRMLDRGGARRPMVLGAALGCVGFVLWAGHLDRMSLGAQWPYIVMAGAGIGLLLGPASTDAVNRAIGASYGEVTGITQTVRNYGSALGMAVFGTVLTTVLAGRLTTSLTAFVPRPQAASIAHAATYGTDAAPRASSAPPEVRARLNTVVAHDFSTATQWVLYGMAIALGATFLAALRHPGRRHAPVTAAEPRVPQAAVDR
ncbi:MAG: MFS transporter [Catenulispora sp.]|nr:MFS transporter [Catenulispora sp.]